MYLFEEYKKKKKQNQSFKMSINSHSVSIVSRPATVLRPHQIGAEMTD